MDRSTRTSQSTPRCSQRRGTRSAEGHSQESSVYCTPPARRQVDLGTSPRFHDFSQDHGYQPGQDLFDSPTSSFTSLTGPQNDDLDEVDLDNANGASPHHVYRPPLMDLSSQINSTPLRTRSRETNMNSSNVIMLLQNQQQLIQKLLSQQENMQQKQQEKEKLVQFQTKFDSAVSSSSASSTENKGKTVPWDLTVSEIH